jgi:peptidoglycan/LPS O-acetylase OafA/YrhL
VLLVVSYHAGFFFKGGFAGVDVFFAISGFVVCGAIHRESYASWRSFIYTFFSRRLLRLTPLFIMVNIFTIFAAIFFLSPFGEIQQVSHASLAGIFFVSNTFFQFKDSYWDLVDHPLRHLWSLSVEEQFYIFFPIALVSFFAIFKRSKRRFLYWTFFLIGIAIISLVFCLYLTKNSSRIEAAKFGFYSSPARAWQFLSGVVAFYFHSFFGKYITSTFSVFLQFFGIFLIAFSIVNIDSEIGWPDRWSPILIIGVFLILISDNCGKGTRSILAFKPLTWFGDHSYGWYLWHWPILVLGRKVFGDSTSFGILLILVALGISIFTKIQIEDRFRVSSIEFRRFSLIGIWVGNLGLIAFAVLAMFISSTSLGLTKNSTEDGLGESTQNVRGGCFDEPIELDDILIKCTNGVPGDGLDVLLVGDSQAPSVSDGLFDAGKSLHLSVAGIGLAGCPFSSTTPLVAGDKCAAFQGLYFDAIQSLRPSIVVIAQRSDGYVSGFDERPELAFPSKSGFLPMNKREQSDNLLESYQDALSRIRSDGIEIYVLAETKRVQMPPQSLFELLFGLESRREKASIIENNQIRNRLLTSMKVKFQGFDDIHFSDPSIILCESENLCPSTKNGVLIYRDTFHLNRFGSETLFPFWRDILAQGMR